MDCIRLSTPRNSSCSFAPNLKVQIDFGEKFSKNIKEDAKSKIKINKDSTFQEEFEDERDNDKFVRHEDTRVERGNGNWDDKGCHSETHLKKLMKYTLSIYDDQSGSLKNLCHGFSIIAMCGTLLGILMPKDKNLPTPWYRVVSSIIGYTYFMSWSIAYYPQVITNYRRKSVLGLSTDYATLTMLNCFCYAIYNSFFYWDEEIRQAYKNKNGGPLTIESNDVAYSIHALLIAVLQIFQVTYYGGFSTNRLSKVIIALTTVVTLFSFVYVSFIILQIQGFEWINFLYVMAIIKIILTAISYVPQLILNSQRKSTVGFNIWAIILDFCGGTLSMIQLLLDSIDLKDFRGGIIGNWAKLLLGMVTLILDTAFFVQHYVLYYEEHLNTKNMESQSQYKLLKKESVQLHEYGAC